MHPDNLSISNSKTEYTRAKAVITIIAFIVILCVITGIAGKSYEEATQHNTINYFTKSRYDGFYELPQNSVDMVFLGSSHSYCTFDPENFDEAFGTSSWQMGTPLQTTDTTYYSLLRVLETQSPKVVVIEIYWDMLDDDFLIEQAKNFFAVLENDELQNAYIKEVFPLGEKVKYRIKPIRYQADFFAYKASEIKKSLQEKYGVYDPPEEENAGEEDYRSKGYVYCDYVMSESEYDKTNQYKNFDGHSWEMKPEKAAYLEKIAKLCEEKGIKLIFVTAPIAPVSMDYIKNYDEVHEKLSDLARNLNVPYIDYNEKNYNEKILTNEYFRDDAHLNDRGVKVIDGMFKDYLVENGYFQERIDNGEQTAD